MSLEAAMLVLTAYTCLAIVFHFPIYSSNKCGSVCRVGRNWQYVAEVSRETGSDIEEW